MVSALENSKILADRMPETLAEHGISIGQRAYAVFKVQATCGDHEFTPQG